MTIFVILILFFVLLHLPALFKLELKFLQSRKDKARVAVALMFILAGVSHFAAPDTFLKMMPDFLPAHLAMVYLSGIFEIAGGVGLLIPRFQRLAAWGLVALLVVVLPVNINVAVNNIQLGGWMNHPLYQWIRVPFQLVLIWWVVWSNQLLSWPIT